MRKRKRWPACLMPVLCLFNWRKISARSVGATLGERAMELTGEEEICRDCDRLVHGGLLSFTRFGGCHLFNFLRVFNFGRV